mgnify:FL=1
MAIGQAGGNIGALLEKRGHDVFFLNTSEEDLNLLSQSLHKYHLKGGEGCNKDRNKAKKLLAANVDEVLRQVQDVIQQKIVFVIFSSGGGTGSGMGPLMVELLQQECAKQAGAVVVLPGHTETVKAHCNAYECAKELADIQDMAATFFLDNDTRPNKLRINEVFVELFESFLKVPEHTSVRGNIDRAEVKEMLITSGAAVIQKLVKQESTTAKLIDSLHKSIFAPYEQDKAIRYIALSAAGDIQTEALEREFGVVLDAFQTYDAPATVCCLSGLSYPFTRILEIRDKVKENQSAILESAKAVTVNKLSEDIDLFGGLSKPEPVRKTSSRDLLKKYL